jgi:predicted ATP-binding protein involved in virulence
MRISGLQLTNVRSYKSIELAFQPGMNLIAGINGCGKSTLLDSLAILLSHVMPKVSQSKARPFGFAKTDRRRIEGAKTDETAGSLTATIKFHAANKDWTFTIHDQDEDFQHKSDEWKRKQGIQTPDLVGLFPKLPIVERDLQLAQVQPVVAYYSVRRSIINLGSAKSSSVGGKQLAYSEALRGLELRLNEFVEWWRSRKVMEQEAGTEEAKIPRETLRQAIRAMLPGCSNIRYIKKGDEFRFLVTKDNIELDIQQLSDGERGIFCMALDLARRLSVANPKINNPLEEVPGIVLIDELDLHLHPKWQRQVVHDLTRTFPNIQFIATTHSPQILGEVEADRITLLQQGGPPLPVHQTFGMDSNWILKHIMGTESRNSDVDDKIEAIMKAIREAKLQTASKLVTALRAITGETPDIAAADAKIARAELLVGNTKKKKAAPKKRRGS